MDITSQVIEAINGWLQSLASSVLQPALNAAGQLLFQTPQFDRLPEVRQAWSTTRDVTDALFLLAVLAGGLLVMASGTFETEYTAKRILPRLVLAALLANLSLAATGALVSLSNAVGNALLGQSAAPAVWAQVTLGLTSPNAGTQVITSLVALAAALLAVLLVIAYIARDLVLLLLIVLAPLALATYSLPHTDEIARLWGRGFTAALLLQPLQALLISLGVKLVGHSDWLGTPTSALVDGLVLVTLLYLNLRLPFAAYRWAFRHPAAQNRVVRTVVVAAKMAAAAAA